MTSRRTFLAAGVAGGIALGFAWWWRDRPAFVPGEAGVDALTALDRSAPAIVAAIVPVQKELGELFALLGFGPARIALARVLAPWNEADESEVAAFLERWRVSGFLLLRSAYDALHQIVLAAWYGNPRSWPAIGYPGPPDISS
jgi:hypothetical protein